MCYGPNVNITCPRAANYIKEEHTKINAWVVRNLKKVYIGWFNGADLIFVPMNPANVHGNDNLSSFGYFAIYDPKTGKFDLSARCNGDFFPAPNWRGNRDTHHLECNNSGVPGTFILAGLYVKRAPGAIRPNGRGGIAGYHRNGVAHDFHVDHRFGYNTDFILRDDWNYNPI